MSVTAYSIAPGLAKSLAGAAAMPVEQRAELLCRLRAEIGDTAFVGLFAQFIGLANSVAENARAMTDDILMIEGMSHPDRPAPANLPTIVGALAGVTLAAEANADPSLICETCAFRLGTPANQSPITTADAEYCAAPGGPIFHCHEPGRHRRACAGFAKARADAMRRMLAEDSTCQ